MKKLISLTGMFLVSFVIANAPTNVAQAGETPYVVRGNQHIMIGVTLDEAAIRTALPQGLEPAEGVTGGINIYTSKGGEGVAAYSRSYIWVDLKGHDSINGAKARYVLWAATSTPGKLQKVGTPEFKGETVLNKNGKSVTGALTMGGKKTLSGSIELAKDGKCGPIAGTLNYPSLPKADGKLMVTQYTFAGTACGAAPKTAEISVDAGHALAKFKPTKLIWAAYVPDLSFAGSPLINIKMAEKK